MKDWNSPYASANGGHVADAQDATRGDAGMGVVTHPGCSRGRGTRVSHHRRVGSFFDPYESISSGERTRDRSRPIQYERVAVDESLKKQYRENARAQDAQPNGMQLMKCRPRTHEWPSFSSYTVPRCAEAVWIRDSPAAVNTYDIMEKGRSLERSSCRAHETDWFGTNRLS